MKYIDTMKRLQLRHHNELFSSRSLALEFFTNILNPNRVENTKFGASLYAEPMVAKYLDNNGKIQILLAIGTDTPDAPYHIIDSADILEQILINKTNLELEINRAITSEGILQNKIELEKERINSNITRLGTIEDTVGDKSKGLVYKVNLIQSELDGLNGGAGSITTQIETAINALALPDTYASKSAFETLVGKDTEKSARDIATEEVIKLIASADTKYDTLKEIADYIANDITSAATLANTVSDLVAISANTRLETIENIVYITSGNTNVSINDYIIYLENKVKLLEEKIENITISSDQVKEIIKEYLKGFANEIDIKPEVSENGVETLVVKFADDAIFGPV